MSTLEDPHNVVVQDGRSIREVAESLNDPSGDRPAGLLLEECIAADPRAVLWCQDRTFGSAARVLHGILKARDFIERHGNSAKASASPASEKGVAEGKTFPDVIAATGDFPSISANDLKPLEDDEEDWSWDDTASGN